MVEQIRISPEEVRGYGNICEGHTLEDFIVSNSGLAKEKEDVHGALTSVYRLVYSVYGLMFYFDKGAKQLYLQTNEADTLSLGFDTENKQLYLVDENDTGFSLDFDEDTNELYITDDVPPIVHNYTLALDSESYTTTGSLSVSATLLDDGVAVEGATVSFTGGTSTVTATTDSSGVATATVNFTSSGTLTATYSNVSDTASVTVQTYIFYDDATTDKSTNYNGCITFRNTQSCMGLTYESNNTRYKLTENGSKAHNLHIIPLDGYKNIKIEYDFYLDSTYYYYGFIMYKDGSDNVTWNLSHNELFKGQTTSGSYTESQVKSVSSVTGKWLHYEITVSNKQLTMNLYKDDSLYHTETWTLSDTIWDNTHYGFAGWGNSGDKIAYFKNLVVESL